MIGTLLRTGLTRGAILGLCALAAVACGDGDDDATPTSPEASPSTTVTEAPLAITATENQPLTSTRSYDVFAPTEAGPWPVVVVWHPSFGAFDPPDDYRKTTMEPLARAIAEQGAVVYNASYDSSRPVAAVNDSGCAIQTAVETAADYGGDIDRLVLVGHSGGGLVATNHGLGQDAEPLGVDPFVDCLADGDRYDVQADAVVSLAALYEVDRIIAIPEVDPQWRELSEEQRAEIDPYQLIDRNTDVRFFLMDAPDAPGLEALGTLGSAVRFRDALVAADYDVVLPDTPAQTHPSPREPGTEDFDRTIDLVTQALNT